MKISECVARAIVLVNNNLDLANIEISGTIISLKACQNNGRTGMTYLTLSDGDSANDKIDAVLYQVNDKLEENVIIKCRGRLQIYVSQRDSRKQLQYRIQSFEICGQSGDSLYIKLKQKLVSDGVITREHKPIPKMPRKIGLIGGIKNDGTFDVLNKLNTVCFCEVYVYDTVLTPSVMIERINYANYHNVCDVLLIVRGGGSKEDLATLNDYDLAVCVKQSKIPIISGIGHTMDHTIIDDVSDQSCETPTATAYSIMAKYEGCLTDIEILMSRYNEIVKSCASTINTLYEKLNVIEHAYDLTVERFMDRFNSLIIGINSNIVLCTNSVNSAITQECWQLTSDITHKCKLFKSIVLNISDNINEEHTKLCNTHNDMINSYESQIDDMLFACAKIENTVTISVSRLFNDMSSFGVKVFSDAKHRVLGPDVIALDTGSVKGIPVSDDKQLLTMKDASKYDTFTLVFLDGSMEVKKISQ